METIEAILSRRSVRGYTEEPVTDEELDTIIKCAMSGPSCTNARDWSFIVVRDRDTLCKMADANGMPARPLRTAAVGILICGDLDRAFPPAKDYWIIDGAIAGQNICLAAHDLGLGAVWLGTYPQMERVNALRELFALPENIVPHSIISIGRPSSAPLTADQKRPPAKPLVPEEHLHWEKWQGNRD